MPQNKTRTHTISDNTRAFTHESDTLIEVHIHRMGDSTDCAISNSWNFKFTRIAVSTECEISNLGNCSGASLYDLPN